MFHRVARDTWTRHFAPAGVDFIMAAENNAVFSCYQKRTELLELLQDKLPPHIYNARAKT